MRERSAVSDGIRPRLPVVPPKPGVYRGLHESNSGCESVNPGREASEDEGSCTQEGPQRGNEDRTNRRPRPQERIAHRALDDCRVDLDEL